MPDKDALKGLGCPRCGGMVPIPEGQAIVVCPFCEMRSVVRGESGVRRYQVPQQIDRAAAEQAFKKFLGNWAIARSVPRQAQVNEVFMVHLPFWATWGRALAWFFGQKQEGSGDHRHWVPKEVRVTQDLTWNGAACEVGEFGVTQISLEGRPLQPCDTDVLHRSGMVFEPTSSSLEALEQSRVYFENETRSQARLERVSQSFVRIVRPRQGLVFYPLWVIRYAYRGRDFQVVVDAFSGEVLYGKAPGNVYYRAAVLVGGMAAGAFITVDLSSLLLSGKDSSVEGGIAVAIAGLALMYFSFRRYRYGEHYEYRRKFAGMLGSGLAFSTSTRQVFDVIRSLEKFS
jgi:hypothetical protein